VVNSASLAGTARELRVGNALLLGKGEDSSVDGSSLDPADAMEALIGAIYLEWIRRGRHHRAPAPRGQIAGRRQRAWRRRLQDTPPGLCAQVFDELPVYRVTDSGPDHAKVFEAQVIVGGARGGRDGRSKKQAEQMPPRTPGTRSRLTRPPAPPSDRAARELARRL